MDRKTPPEGQIVQSQELTLALQALAPDSEGTLVLDRLPASKQEEARQIAASLRIEDSEAVVNFGTGAQRELVRFTDTILNDVRNRDAGEAGDLLIELKGHLEDVDPSALRRAESALSKIFPFLSAIRRMLARYEKLAPQISGMEKKFERERSRQVRHMTTLDLLYEQNLKHFHYLELHIAAGEIKIQELVREFELRRMTAQSTKNIAELAAFKEFYEQIQTFDRRIFDLKLARTAALTSGPTIRVAQNGAKQIIEFIKSAVLLMIPEWRKQVVLAIALHDQKRAMSMVNAAREMTDQLVRSNVDLLGLTQEQIKTAHSRGFVAVEALEEVSTKLIQTIQRGIEMDRANWTARQEGARRLENAEQQLKEALKAVETAREE